MSNAANSTFVYVTYIRTTPERLWSALTTPEFMRQYWYDMHIDSDWRHGSPWRLLFRDGRVADSGSIGAGVASNQRRRPRHDAPKMGHAVRPASRSRPARARGHRV